MESPLSLDLIVAATDFSDGARAAFRTAHDLATRSGAALHLVHVALHEDETLRRYAPDFGGPEGAVRAWADETLGAGRLDDVSFEPIVILGGPPEPAVLEYVEEHRADLLVVGTHGRRGPRRWVMGSVAERLVRFSPCPVLTVPYRSFRIQPGKAVPVLAAIDFSSATPNVLAWAKRLAALYDAPLDLLHVIAEAVPAPRFYPALQRPPLRSILDTAPDLDRRTREELDQEFLGARGPGVEAYTHVRTGVPSNEITALARDREAALIVMGTQGLAGLELFMLGSTAAKTVRSAPCAVLTTRRPEAPETGASVSRSSLATA